MAQKKFIWTISELLDILKQSKDKNIKVECKRWREKRNNNQNNYFHLIVQILADELWYDKDEMKEILKFKFIRVEAKHWIYTRKTSELNTEEMAKFTDNILKWSATELNIILPTPEDYRKWEHYEKILLS